MEQKRRPTSATGHPVPGKWEGAGPVGTRERNAVSGGGRMRRLFWQPNILLFREKGNSSHNQPHYVDP